MSPSLRWTQGPARRGTRRAFVPSMPGGMEPRHSPLSEGRLPYPAIGVSSGAAAPGRPKQGPTLSEGRLPYPAIGVSS